MPASAARAELTPCPQCPGRGQGGRSRRRAASATAPLIAALVGACSGPPGAGRRLGADLGTFSVEASEADGGCGAGALGSTPRFRFDVELSRADSELFWDGQGGTIDESSKFEVAARSSVVLRPARGSDPGCSVLRDDVIWGLLLADAAGAVVGLSGTMRFTFQAAAGSACTLDDTAEAAVERLPCSLSYELEGSRTRAPEP